MVFGILKHVQAIVNRGLHVASTVISRWTKPAMHHHALNTIVDLARSKPQLLAENLLLRQQLVVLNRSIKRPRFTCADRSLMVLLSSILQNWKKACSSSNLKPSCTGIAKGLDYSGNTSRSRCHANQRYLWRRSPSLRRWQPTTCNGYHCYPH